MEASAKRNLIVTWGAVIGVVIVSATSLILARPAAATAEFAKQTGKACGDCHTNAKGGGPLTPFGEKFKANGNKLPN
jgi:mono/diheme cytochrome c family protein